MDRLQFMTFEKETNKNGTVIKWGGITMSMTMHLLSVQATG